MGGATLGEAAPSFSSQALLGSLTSLSVVWPKPSVGEVGRR